MMEQSRHLLLIIHFEFDFPQQQLNLFRHFDKLLSPRLGIYRVVHIISSQCLCSVCMLLYFMKTTHEIVMGPDFLTGKPNVYSFPRSPCLPLKNLDPLPLRHCNYVAASQDALIPSSPSSNGPSSHPTDSTCVCVCVCICACVCVCVCV